MDMERKYQFTLTRSLENATKCPFLSGWTVYVTKSCQPSPAQFDPIISKLSTKEYFIHLDNYTFVWYVQ